MGKGGMAEIQDVLQSIADELKRANDLAERRFATEHPSVSPTTGKRVSASKLNQMSYPTVQSWNDKYKETHPDVESGE